MIACIRSSKLDLLLIYKHKLVFSSIISAFILIILISVTFKTSGIILSKIIPHTLFYTSLIYISITDQTTLRIPNKITLIGIPIAYILSVSSIVNDELIIINQFTHLYGGIILGSIFSIVYLMPRTKLGAGDVKLAIYIGIFIGFPYMLLSGLIGLITALLINIRKIALKTESIEFPLGSGLAISAIAVDFCLLLLEII